MTPEEINEVLQTYPAIAELITDKDAKIKALTEDLEQATQALEALQNQPAAESATSNLPTVTVNKEEFQFTAPRFSYKGTEYAAQEAAKLQDLCAELVKIGAGILQKVQA